MQGFAGSYRKPLFSAAWFGFSRVAAGSVVDPSDIESMGITHYLPHHAAIKEDKQTSKLRIVYDASARSNG